MNSNRCSTSVCASALLALASLAFSPAAWSLGLGDARVESYLNQPLRARIDLITQASDDLASVTAQLASAADYELIGASRESVSVPIRFTVEEIDGDAYILATSNLPLGDPVVRLIVEVNWSSGRMLREYTLFLDPPTVAEPAPAPRIDLRQDRAAPAATPAADRDAGAAAPSAGDTAADAAARPAPGVPAGGAEYGPVQSGQTLWGIASNWSSGSGLDVNKVMIAIQRENPDAFMKDNINLLKRGAILRMPDVADVQAIPTAAAYREVAAQSEAFSGRAASTVASPDTPLLAGESAAFERAATEIDATEIAPTEIADEEPPPSEAPPAAAEPSAGEEAAPAAEADAAAPQQDLLELVPPSADSELDSAAGLAQGEEGAGASLQTLREELARKEEELITQQQQNAYLEERLQELESQLESAGEGGVADAELANMEERLREQRQVAASAPSEPDKPWYSRMIVWLVALLVLAAAFVGWLVSRRGHGGEAAAAAHSPLRDIKHEAEDVLRVLGEDREGTAAAEQAAATAGAGVAKRPAEKAGESAAKAGKEAEVAEVAEKTATGRFAAHEEDAELLDEESSDPEIQLDLARAYISMGDREAARVILEEVVNNGSEEQQAEARRMLDVLS